MAFSLLTSFLVSKKRIRENSLSGKRCCTGGRGGGEDKKQTNKTNKTSNAVLGRAPNSMIPSPPMVFPKQLVRMAICSFPFALAFVKPDLPI